MYVKWNVEWCSDLCAFKIQLKVPIPKDVDIVLTMNSDGVFTGCGETQRRYTQ